MNREDQDFICKDLDRICGFVRGMKCQALKLHANLAPSFSMIDVNPFSIGAIKYRLAGCYIAYYYYEAKKGLHRVHICRDTKWWNFIRRRHGGFTAFEAHAMIDAMKIRLAYECCDATGLNFEKQQEVTPLAGKVAK